MHLFDIFNTCYIIYQLWHKHNYPLNRYQLVNEFAAQALFIIYINESRKTMLYWIRRKVQ